MIREEGGSGGNGMRPILGLYVGGMGSREKNFYNRLVSSYGFEHEAEQVQELYLASRKSEAMLALSDDLIDAVSIAGSPQRAKERIRAFRDAGVETLIVSPMAFDNDERKKQLHLVAELANEGRRECRECRLPRGIRGGQTRGWIAPPAIPGSSP